MIWDGRKGEAQAGYPRAELQLKAGDVSPPSSHDASCGNLRRHIPTMGTGSWGPGALLLVPPPTPRRDPHLLSKATSHRDASPRALVRCLPFGTRERSSRSDPVCQVHLKTQTAAFSFPILKCEGPQNPGESPGLSPTPTRSGGLLAARPLWKTTRAAGSARRPDELFLLSC